MKQTEAGLQILSFSVWNKSDRVSTVIESVVSSIRRLVNAKFPTQLVSSSLSALPRLCYTIPLSTVRLRSSLNIINEIESYRSPYILWRFLLGLPPGVTSRCLEASFNAFLSAFGSIKLVVEFPDALSFRNPFSSFNLFSTLLLSAAGGVVDRGGVVIGGVLKAFDAFLMCA
jgi:hypothetical protein